MAGKTKITGKKGLAEPAPHYHGHRERLRNVDVAKPLGIAVHDHIVVGKEGHASFQGLKLI
jgi:DNA repair protein RadC